MSESQTLEHPYGGRATMLMGVTWTMAGTGIILMLLRTYLNGAIIKHFCWDYYWALLALITAIVGQSFQTVATASGLGNHFDLLDPQNQVAALKYSFLGHVPIVNGIGFGKLAVVAFLLRIQDRGHQKQKWVLYFVGVSNCVANVILTILILLQCEPLDRQWNASVPGACKHVERTTNAGYFIGSWAAASDVLLAIYPIIVYRKLQISLKDKVALFILFSGGVCAGASSVIKTVYIKLFDHTTDKTYSITDLVLWELVECWLVLILGSLPPLRALYLHLSRKGPMARSRTRCNMHPGHGRFSIHHDSMYPVKAKRSHGYSHSRGGQSLSYSQGHKSGNSHSYSGSYSRTYGHGHGYGQSLSFTPGHKYGLSSSNTNTNTCTSYSYSHSQGHSHGTSDGSEDMMSCRQVATGGGIVKTTNIRISCEGGIPEGEGEGEDEGVEVQVGMVEEEVEEGRVGVLEEGRVGEEVEGEKVEAEGEGEREGEVEDAEPGEKMEV